MEQLEKAKKSAAGSISLRVHHRHELKTKLLDKGYDEAIADQALDRMEEVVFVFTQILQSIMLLATMLCYKPKQPKEGLEQRRDLSQTSIKYTS